MVGEFSGVHCCKRRPALGSSAPSCLGLSHVTALHPAYIHHMVAERLQCLNQLSLINAGYLDQQRSIAVVSNAKCPHT